MNNRNIKRGTTLARVRSAERGTRNGFTTFHFAHKELFKCGVRNAERGTALRSAECGTRSAERRYANAECRMQNSEFRMQNCFTTFHFAHKENIYVIKCILVLNKNSCSTKTR